MKQYIGTKVIKAKPMTRLEYNQFRGLELPSNENGADAGYLVEYVDGGKPNTEQFAGYVSWSPAKQFENAYRETSCMSFGLAIEALKKGLKVARAGWNGKGMWLILTKLHTHTPLEQAEVSAVYVPFITMKASDGKFVPWLASQTDVLVDDWMIV